MSRIILHKIVNNKLYVYTDSKMRLIIPRFFSCPYGRKIYRLYYLGDNTIQAVIHKESRDSHDSARLHIPLGIQKIMDIQVHDAFEVNQCDNGFLLKRVNKEDIE